MKWVTREKVKVDRVACPWLIQKFIDPEAEFLFVPSDRVLAVAEQQQAVPYDVPGVKYGHHDGRCSFEALIAEHELKDPALLRLAKIVHGADVSDDLYGTPEAPGLLAVALGFSKLGLRDHEILEREFIVYDALYAYCRTESAENQRSPEAQVERTIKPGELKKQSDVIVIDVRREADFAAGPPMIGGALRRLPESVETWADELPQGKDIVIYCARGGSVSNSVLDTLLSKGVKARYLEGGIETWQKES